LTFRVHGALPSPVRCYVMMPLAPIDGFLRRLTRTISVLGVSAVVFGALLFGFWPVVFGFMD